MIATSLNLNPEVIGTPFAEEKYFVAAGYGYTSESEYKPTSILIFKIQQERFQPLSAAQIQTVAQNDLRNDLKSQFGVYLFNVRLFHLAPLPIGYTGSIFVSADAYTDHHRLCVAKTFSVENVFNWDAVFNNILDTIEEESKNELSGFGRLDNFGIDWLTFTPQ